MLGIQLGLGVSGPVAGPGLGLLRSDKNRRDKSHGLVKNLSILHFIIYTAVSLHINHLTET